MVLHISYELAVCGCHVSCSGVSPGGGRNTKGEPLAHTQIEKLIQIHTPDDVVAQEVRSRSLDFTPTPKILDQLQQRGAGQATLAAVRERMPVGTIEVQAPPGSQVAVDGTDRGTTDAQGALFAQLAGGHVSVGRKQTGLPPRRFPGDARGARG